MFDCFYCNNELICHNSLDAKDVNHKIYPNTHIVNYWLCNNCDLDYIQEVSIDDKTLSFEPIIRE